MAEPFSLLNDSSDEGSEVELTINKNYAQRYDVWRNKEELQKLKDLSKNISDTSSESEEEVEPVIEKDFLKTLSLLKSKDPRIYDEKAIFFTEEQPIVKKPKEKKEKPMFMKDYERKLVLERNGVLSDEEDVHVDKPLTNQESAEVLKSFKEVAPDSDEDDDLFKVRTKTEAEEQKEEEDYKKWLETEKELMYLNKHWNDPNLNEEEKFLKDYILNKKYIVGDRLDDIPTYDDIGMLSEDEKVVEQQEMFEHKYNFRFEEPDEEFIKTYPRTVGDSLRRTNNKRKQKREEYTDRKKKEKEQKREELKRLKALKRKEIEEKFLKLKEASGQEELIFGESDIESDFNPDKHDQKMREMFNEDYYNIEEGNRPEFSYDEEIDDEKWDQWTRKPTNNSINNNKNGNKEHGYSSNDDKKNDKLDSESQFEQEDSTNIKKGRKKKKSLFSKILSEPKPLYDPDGKSFDEYLEEYYKLDFEDVIGDMPVRFKYRKVIPNDFGLTVDEILAAQDRELNQWCSVKKTCQYRRDDEEKYDIQAFEKKAQNFDAKKKILSSVYAPPENKKIITQLNPAESNESVSKPKRKKRSRKKKAIESSGIVNEDANKSKTGELSTNDVHEYSEPAAEVSGKNKKKRKKKKSAGNLLIENTETVPNDLQSNENELVEKDVCQNLSQNDELNHDDTEVKTDISTKSHKKKKKLNSMPNFEFVEEPQQEVTDVSFNEDKIKSSKKRRRKT
ncbi:protein KRI1 homolog [Caerostris extrusa]|uniref:Protein KRI1 homolog n=1 Tax=Caerostris extrusa TaxID=172846 RepID=A0AAV4M6X0_CAEEX|nr:protein KRI1 homolog [Caerostris extrusa]